MEIPKILPVASGEDLFGDQRGLGISRIDFKLTTPDRSIFVLENIFHAKCGPARHLHHNQDEWFYAIEGIFLMEIGSERFELKPGDSIRAPRKIPHVWAHIGDACGRMLVTFTPAGLMEDFFREVTQKNAMPPQDPAVWNAYGMELIGPPLEIK